MYFACPKGRTDESSLVISKKHRQLQEQRHHLYMKSLLEVFNVENHQELPENKKQPEKKEREHCRLQLLYHHEFYQSTCHQYGNKIIHWPPIRKQKEVR